VKGGVYRLGGRRGYLLLGKCSAFRTYRLLIETDKRKRAGEGNLKLKGGEALLLPGGRGFFSRKRKKKKKFTSLSGGRGKTAGKRKKGGTKTLSEVRLLKKEVLFSAKYTFHAFGK